MARKQKLELTWIGKENRPRLEPRILLEDPEKSYHAAHRISDDDIFDNRLVFGDNLLALKALEQELTGKIKCIYIDPPYNTGSAFVHYDDGVEHSLWLSLMRDRIEILYRLLRPDGSLWVSLDDIEAHYMKVMVDEVFGRDRFIADISWVKRDGPPNDRAIGAVHEHILVWGRDKPGTSKKTLAEESFNLMPRTEKANSQYKVFKEPDGPDQKGPFRKIDTTANAKGGRHTDSLVYPVVNPYTREEVWPRKGTNWRHNKEEMERLQATGRLYWGVKGTATTPMRKLYLSEVKQGMSAPTVWAGLALNQHASREMELLFGQKAAFETPKPEALLNRIIQMATNEGDWVLDSFAGSGTTGAVAHKMRRRWIMIELHEHCSTLVVPRMSQVVSGDDEGGVTELCSWKGGGGFRYYKIAPSLLEEDEFDNWVINKKYNPEMLAEAMCKLEGFTYAPSDKSYWQHGHSTETDFIYITTQTLSREQLVKLNDEVGTGRSLLVCCGAFRVRKLDDFPRLTLKKIPLAVMAKCEWGKDDYSLEIDALPDAPEPESDELEEVLDDLPANRRKARKVLEGQQPLFSMETE